MDPPHFSGTIPATPKRRLFAVASVSSIQNHNMKRSEDSNRTKRRKIAVACDDCRTRKVRCDGVQPGMWRRNTRNATRADVRQCVGHAAKEQMKANVSIQGT